MANKLINQMGLPLSVANIFAARNIITAKDALSLTEFELMELLDVGLAEVASSVIHISELVSPPYQTVLSLMEQRSQDKHFGICLSTCLKGLDEALCGGIPFGVLTEIVGPAGIGKTQFCLKLSLLATLPPSYGGLNGQVIYIDVESKFSSRRMIEIGMNSFPEIFHKKSMAQEAGSLSYGRHHLLNSLKGALEDATNGVRPTAQSEVWLMRTFGLKRSEIVTARHVKTTRAFAKKSGKYMTYSLQQIKGLILQRQVKLVIIDSMAALVSEEYELGAQRQQSLGWHISFIKSIAEFSQIPFVVTNQVRSQNTEACQYSFQEQSRNETSEYPVGFDSRLVAALGINWAHAVTIRLVLESKSGQRFIKVAKSPISPPLAFAFSINTSGITLLDDNGVELRGTEINKIHCQGFSL